MKNFLFAICACFLATQIAYGQRTEPLQPMSSSVSYDVKKYQTNRSIGRVLLASGVASIIIGGIVFATYAKQGFNGAAPKTAENFLFIIGPGLSLASIPFFVHAKKIKKQALLSLRRDAAPFENKTHYLNTYTAVSLTISF